MGYPTPIIRYLKQNLGLIRDRRVLTLGKLYPSARQVNSMPSLVPELGRVSQENFSDKFLKGYLGASSVSVLDVDPYQGADLITNLNKPVNLKQTGTFDTILDFGTLEHLSNFSCALTNYFKLLETNGSYCFLLPANNWLDHGFFQFSPTFFIDFCAQNSGLDAKDMFYVCGDYLIRFQDCDHYARRVLANTSIPLFVGGVIEKRSSEISLDFLQSKYLDSYSSANKLGGNNKIPGAAQFPEEIKKKRVFRSCISKAPMIPTKTKLRLLKRFK